MEESRKRAVKSDQKSHCSAQAAPEKNRLYILIEGVVDKAAAESLVTSIFQETTRLKPGFDVITDLSKMKIGFPSAALYLRNAMEFLKSRSVRHTVRVVGNSKSALMQFARATNAFRAKYRVSYVTTMEEAEKKLSER